MSVRPTIVAVVGPTAVGKTALAIALAKRFGGEIINTDSRQVYSGMDIGTAKPTPDEQQAARHHLIDIREPVDPISLGEFLPLARDSIANITRRGRLPILCGGTGQYVWALLEGWNVPQVPPDPDYRAGLERRAESEGVDGLWRDLARLAPERADAIGPHNIRRIIRALEVLHHAGGGIAVSDKSAEPPYESLVIGLTADRPALYERIDTRVDSMMAAGFLDEARRLMDEGYRLGEGPLSGVGYSQLGQYLRGEMALEHAVASAKTQTHRLVRRQYTWFKPSDRRIVWLDATLSLPVAQAARYVSGFLSGANRCDTIANQRP